MWPASALTPESTFLMFSRACHRFFDLILDYGISNVTHSRVSLGEIEIEIEIEGTARITYDLSPPSFDRNGITLKKRKKKKKERIRYWNIRNRNDNCTVRTSMDEEHEVDFKVSLSKCF